jgi:hypothetical protein
VLRLLKLVGPTPDEGNGVPRGCCEGNGVPEDAAAAEVSRANTRRGKRSAPRVLRQLKSRVLRLLKSVVPTPGEGNECPEGVASAKVGKANSRRG